MDSLSPETRRRVMQSIRRTGTECERTARLVAKLSGLPYRVNAGDLPGSPDVVFPEDKIALFVHGCFWHRHHCPKGMKVPATNRSFWLAKFAANQQRDRAVKTKLEMLGWEVQVVWECEL